MEQCRKGGGECDLQEVVSGEKFRRDNQITHAHRIVRSTMACVSVAGMHAVARMAMNTVRSRRPFETTHVSLDHARQPAALAGCFSRRVKPHALRQIPSSPSGWTRHEGTGVLFATRGSPGGER